MTTTGQFRNEPMLEFRRESVRAQALREPGGHIVKAGRQRLGEIVWHAKAAAEIGESDRVLDIGSGSGYGAALIAQLRQKLAIAG